MDSDRTLSATGGVGQKNGSFAGVDEAQMMALQNPAIACQPPPGQPLTSVSGKRSGSDDVATVRISSRQFNFTYPSINVLHLHGCSAVCHHHHNRLQLQVACPQASKRQKVTAQSTMRPAGLPTALTDIAACSHGAAVSPSPSSLSSWHSDALLRNILLSINELQDRSEADRGSVAQQAEV